MPAKDSRYSSAYARFIQTIIALRTFSVPLGEIADLFAKEQIVLRLLKVDALGTTSTWYLDQCDNKGHIFISSVQKELAAERRALKDYIEDNVLLRRFFDVFLFEDMPEWDCLTAGVVKWCAKDIDRRAALLILSP